MNFYPIALNLKGCPCLVVGGGHVGERKVVDLLEAEAEVTLVSPEVTRCLADIALTGRLNWLRKEYHPSDINGAKLVFAVTDNPTVNNRIADDCRQAAIWVNVADTPEKCSFTVPAALKRGSLLIAVSTGGKSPALARQVKLQLESVFGEEYGPWVDFLGDLRPFLKEVWPENQKKREEMLQRLAGDEILFRLVARGKKDQAKERVKQCLSLPSV